MCLANDIDAILVQLQNCLDHEEKKRILEQLINCRICQERPVDGEVSCSC